MIRLLSGIRVIELGNFISGPYAGQLLAELGAEVIKVERPVGGDPFRGFDGDILSPQFCAFNRGKRSVTADINKPEGRDVLLQLIQGADVLLENYRPGVLDRVGLNWEVLRQRNPRLIYCTISGFGPDGPYTDRPAFDTVAQCMSGFASQWLDPERPRISGPAMADGISGLYAALGIAAALAGRAADGRGHRIDVSMVEAMVAFTTSGYARFFASGRTPSPYERASSSHAFALRCADGKIIGLHLSSPQKFWDSLLVAIERPDLAADPRFVNRAARIANYEALYDVLAKVFSERPRRDWEERLRREEVPHAPAYTLDEVVEDPHIAHLETFYAQGDSRDGGLRAPHAPWWCDRAREQPDLPPPALGEHTEDELRRVNLTEEDIAKLRAARAI